MGKNRFGITINNSDDLIILVTIIMDFYRCTSEMETLPVQIWRKNEYEIQKAFIKAKEVGKVNLDPNFEFAGTKMKNNSFSKTENKSDCGTFKNKKSKD